MSLPVRLATVEDASVLAELRWLSRSSVEREREPLEQFERTFGAWLQSVLAAGDWRIAVACSEGGAVEGCMYLHFVDKVPVPGEARRSWAYLTNAYVREDLRGEGVGAALLENLIGIARAERAEFVLVWPSREAVPFYERAGFLSAEQERQALPQDEPSLILHLEKRQRGEA